MARRRFGSARGIGCLHRPGARLNLGRRAPNLGVAQNKTPVTRTGVLGRGAGRSVPGHALGLVALHLRGKGAIMAPKMDGIAAANITMMK